MPSALSARILTVTLLITGTAVVAFGVPLGVALSRVEHDRVVLRLERAASQVLAQVPDEALTTGAPPRIPSPVPGTRDADDSAMLIGLYDVSGRRLSGAGPLHSDLAAEASGRGREQVGHEAGQVAVALSLQSDRPVHVGVRVAIASGDVAEDQRGAWWLMGALALGVLLAAGTAAFWLARRLTWPLQALSETARQLGDGDFTVRTDHTGVREIDAVATSLDATAQRLGELLQRERAFSSNASHQLRTPLAALRLNLETLPVTPGTEAAAGVAESVAQLDRLEETVEQLLALARDVERPQSTLDVPAVLGALSARWEETVRKTGRQLAVGAPADGEPEVRGSATSLGHVLDVLVDNALAHGRGANRHVTSHPRRAAHRRRRRGPRYQHRPGGAVPAPVRRGARARHRAGARALAGRGGRRPARPDTPRSRAGVQRRPPAARRGHRAVAPAARGAAPVSTGAGASRVLLVEDDRGIAEPLVRGLSTQGYTVTWTTTAEQALAAVGGETPDLVLLDLGLPDLDGVALCRQLRERLPEAVIVILTARDAEVDVIVGLEAGADDYLVKPFRFVELLARLRAHLRRQTALGQPGAPAGDVTLQVGGVRVDVSARRCYINGVEVLLRPKEFDLLAELARHAGQAISREDLMSRVWDEHWYGSTKTLDMHIGMLRRRLETHGGAGALISTLRGFGYRFEAVPA